MYFHREAFDLVVLQDILMKFQDFDILNFHHQNYMQINSLLGYKQHLTLDIALLEQSDMGLFQLKLFYNYHHIFYLNNYIFSQDPLLFQRPVQQPLDDNQLRLQLEQVMQQYQTLQQPPPTAPQKDILGELDSILKGLDENVANILSNDEEYMGLNNQLQQYIQEELMKSVRWKINSNPDAITCIEKMKSTIQAISREKEIEEKRNMQEINDYLKNYSNITFDEYKKIKESPNKFN